ncbi:MAG: tRNA uridine-5-carboxymethylaminomethyl(34) synthesis GTPase MnmE [Clostridia bacterium]|nr:tRNA uridine-5-carboxymethylaminomethyl(34) synthesis GTPase MnmE [Clostridia bacterium]
MLTNNTICAISTALSPSAISIVRMSGSDALDIARKVFIPVNPDRFNKFESHTIHYGNIVDNFNDNKVLDNVLLTYMKGPKTYTGEDIIEINCHGGTYVTKEVLALLLKNGASMAEAGEFTKRSFLNGKMDLSQAEAIMDLINSETKMFAESSINQIRGSLSFYIKEMKNEVLNILSKIELNIDYPEYDEPELTIKEIKDKLLVLDSKLDDILKTSDTGKIIKEGIKTAIVGKPNVGKSSLLNNILKEERAIVTDIPGTTRDTVEETINLDGIPLKLIDTAGIRRANDEVEKIGIEKSKDLVSSSDLVIAMFDKSRELSDEDFEILKLLKDKKSIVVINKSDLDSKIDINELGKYINTDDIIYISAKNDLHLTSLEDKIKTLFFNNDISINNDIIITNIRHKDSLLKAKSYINEAINEASNNTPQDLIAIKLESAMAELSLITGESISEEVVNAIFHNFCVGK